MNVALPNKPPIRPGFGKLPERPSFDKKSLANSKSSTTTSASPLKQNATQTVSTATLSDECRTRASSSKSYGPFVGGTHAMGVGDYVRNRSETIAHGTFKELGGKYQLESDMGMTRRSTNRLLQQANMQQAQQLAYLNQMNAMYSTPMAQPKMTFADFAMGLMEMFKNSGLFGGSSVEKGGQTGNAQASPTSNNETVAAMQNAKSPQDLSTAINAARGKLSEIGSSLSTIQGELKTLQNNLPNLKTASSDAKTALDNHTTAITQKQGEVQNNINSENASKMAMNAAQQSVNMLKSQLNNPNLSTVAKAGLESSLRQAETQLKLKTEQYEETVKNRELSQKQLQELNNQTQGLKDAADLADKNLKQCQGDIQQKQQSIGTLQASQKEITEGITAGEQRLQGMPKDGKQA